MKPAEGEGDRKVICPHCWHRFGVEELLAIAQHQSLLGDPVLGPEAAQRFLPSRFTPEGHAIDAHGLACSDFACPRCHLGVPHPIMEKPPLFLSMIGAPGSGKSYLLTTMISKLRTLMPSEFASVFGDADPVCNQIINEYERILFHCSDDEVLVTLKKTEMHGEMYDSVVLDDMAVNLPHPFMFSLAPQPHHPWYKKREGELTKSLVLYDNAGEHFEPGMDSATNPGTHHLSMSEGLFFVFDPTKDVRFRRECKSDDPQIKPGTRVERQEILLAEAIARIRRAAGMLRSKKYEHPLLVVVTKYDIWRDLFDHPLRSAWQQPSETSSALLDFDTIMAASFALRHLMMKLCPEFVSTAEAFASKVVYIPVSAMGRSPEEDPENPDSGALLVRPKDIKPIWATVPFLTMLGLKKLTPMAKRRKDDRVPSPKVLRVSGDRVVISLSKELPPLEVPNAYLGCLLRHPESGKWFRMVSAKQLSNPSH